MAKTRRRGRPTGVNGKAAPKKAKKIDLLIDTIFSVLPATTQEEILRKVTKRWKGKPLTLEDISGALSHLRRNAVKYAWTVPYVTPGAPTEEDTGRYFIAEVNPDGSRKKCSPRNQRHLVRGASRVIKTVSRLNNNEAVAIDIVRPTLPLAFQPAARSLARRVHMFSQQETQLLADLRKLDVA